MHKICPTEYYSGVALHNNTPWQHRHALGHLKHETAKARLTDYVPVHVYTLYKSCILYNNIYIYMYPRQCTCMSKLEPFIRYARHVSWFVLNTCTSLCSNYIPELYMYIHYTSHVYCIPQTVRACPS